MPEFDPINAKSISLNRLTLNGAIEKAPLFPQTPQGAF
jgi:hypothetical protein